MWEMDTSLMSFLSSNFGTAHSNRIRGTTGDRGASLRCNRATVPQQMWSMRSQIGHTFRNVVTCLGWHISMTSCKNQRWTSKSAGMWRCTVGRAVPDVSKNRSAFVFRVNAIYQAPNLTAPPPSRITGNAAAITSHLARNQVFSLRKIHYRR